MNEPKWYVAEMELNYNEPIFAKNKNGTQILLPVRLKDSYEVIGFDWFTLESGTWGSCKTWETASGAVKNRMEDGYEVYNAKIIIENL